MKKVILSMAFMIFAIIIADATQLYSADEVKTVFRSEEAANKDYKIYCIQAEIEDKDFRVEMERAFLEFFSTIKEIIGYEGGKLFPPRKNIEDEKVFRRLRGMSIQALLRIKFAESTGGAGKTLEMELHDASSGIHLWTGITTFSDDELSKENRKANLHDFAKKVTKSLFDNKLIYDCGCDKHK